MEVTAFLTPGAYIAVFSRTPGRRLCRAFLGYAPLWDEAADPESSGRRSGLSRLLADIGPLPIAIVCAGIAAVALYLAVKARAPKHAKNTESQEH